MKIGNLDVGAAYSGGALVNNVFHGSEPIWMQDFPNDAWDYEFDAVFTGSQSLEIPTAQTITSEYQCFFEGELTPLTPTGSEVIYCMNTASSDLGVYLNSNGTDVSMRINGMSGAFNVGTYVVGERLDIKIEFKVGGWRVTTGENTTTGSVTWADLSWASYLVGTRASGGLNYSGTISYFKDCNETFNFRNESLVGSLGTIPIETGVITFEAQGPSVPLGVVVNDGGVIKQSSYTWNNDGADLVNLGRPSYIDNMRPGVDEFTIDIEFKCTEFKNQTLFSIYGSTGNRQLDILLRGDTDYFKSTIGGAIDNVTGFGVYLDQWIKLRVAVGLTEAVIIRDGVVVGTTSVGGLLSTSDLVIGGLSWTSSQNFQGVTSKVSFYSGANIDASNTGLVLLDAIDFGNTDQWDVGSTGVSQNGTAFTLTDGVPSDAHLKTLVPV